MPHSAIWFAYQHRFGVKRWQLHVTYAALLTSSLNRQIRYEMWRGFELQQPPHFWIQSHKLDKDPTRDKVAARSIEGVFIDYTWESKGFRVRLPNVRKIVFVRNMCFVENVDRASADLTILEFEVRMALEN